MFDMESKKFKCLVVDDEPIARKIVMTYIRQSPNLEVVAECKNAIEALEILRVNSTIDIVFLDINMPNLSGISMVRVLKNQSQIIFTTAYHEYAVESYELDAADYMLKPFSFERFTKGVIKAINRIENNKIEEQPKPIQIKSDGKIYFVDFDDILFCEAMRNHTRVFLNNGTKLMPLVSLSKFEHELSESNMAFIRVHRSFIISKKWITAIKGNTILFNSFKVPIGNQYKEEFLKKIKL
jgi:DNA-binding LytR/AlgR family response regulator